MNDNFSADTILKDLNARQRQAVTQGEGPLMVVAGAGTGKTRVITHRIAYLIATKKAKPDEILALTFTDKAAAEMEERVDVMLPYGFTNVWISTFHSFGDRIVRDNAFALKLTPDFQVLSEAEQAIFFREHLFEYPLHQYRPLGNPTKFIQALLKLISRAKDENVNPEQYLAHARELMKSAETTPENSEQRELAAQQLELAQAYEFHQRILRENGKLDFGDQVTLALALLTEHPHILRATQQRFKYILVDEFQDTNYAQFELLRLLAGAAKNIAVVADDDQSIYKFRGAAISNVLNFLKCYPEARTIVLTENYRSTQSILNTAYRLITHNNPERLEVQSNIDKRLVAQRGDGAAVSHKHYDTLTSEADAVAKIIEGKIEGGDYRYRDFAILVRANNDADPFLRSMNMRKIPFQFSGSRGLYSCEEVRVLILFLRVITDFDDSASLFHLAMSEIYQCPDKDLVRCANFATRKNLSLHHIFEHLDEYEDLIISEEGRATVQKLLADVTKYLESARYNPAGVVLYKYLIESGYLKRLTRGDALNADTKLSNIAKFFDLVRNFSEITLEHRVPEFVRHLNALIEAGDDPAAAQADSDTDAVNVLTIHKAKGLEFRVVFMVSLIQDRFPVRRKSDPLLLPDELINDILPGGDFHLQEERRLFYVGMTRAQEELYFTSARDYGGMRQRKVSQFVLEALDAPRADETYIRTPALEAIQHHAPLPEKVVERAGRIPDDQVLNLSYYQIDDYLTCPLKYKYIHVLKVPILPHHAVIYGRSLHEAVSEYYRHKINGQPVPIDFLKEIFRRSWLSDGFISREHEDTRFSAGEKALERFYLEQEECGFTPFHVEEKFSFLLENDRVNGRWDFIYIDGSAVHIIDFKSSEIRDQEKANRAAKDSLQLSIYGMAYAAVYNKTPDFLELYYLETGIIGSSVIDDKRLQQTREKVKRAAAGIRDRNYDPNPNYLACEYCPYNHVCPATVSK